MKVELTRHAQCVIEERGIDMEWVTRAIEAPAHVEEHPDGTRHHCLAIPERDGRVLRVVATGGPTALVVMAFFDRRLRRAQL